MSIIQNIRDKGAWIIFTIIVIALVAFVLQDGIGKKGINWFGRFKKEEIENLLVSLYPLINSV